MKEELTRFLSPLPPEASNQLENQVALFSTPEYATMQRGWPLGKAISPLELLAVASRVPGVLKINKIYVADATMGLSRNVETPDAPTCSDLPVTLTGLQLPRIMTLNVAIGEALSINQLRGDEDLAPIPPTAPGILPVPVIPDEC